MAGDTPADRSDASRHTDPTVRRLERLADLMDDRFELPVVGYRVGLDPLLGLLPVGGDWVAWSASIYIFWEALRLDIPRPVLLKMAWNLLLDLVVGSLPVAGDLFDAAFKANVKNVELVRDELAPAHSPGSRADEPHETETSSRLARLALGAAVTIASIALAGLPVALVWWLAG